jgi:hypothetical protein
MAASRQANNLVGAAADLADKYGPNPADMVAWIARNVEGRSPAEVARIRRNLQPLGSNRNIVEAGVVSNENRFRRAGGVGARKADDVEMPVRYSAAFHKPQAIPAAVVRETPGALRAVGNYIQTSTPMGVAEDVGNMARSGYNSFVKDPYGAVFNGMFYAALPTPALITDYARMREGSQMLDPYAENDAAAARAQSMVDAVSVLPTLSVVPAARGAARKVSRAALMARR